MAEEQTTLQRSALKQRWVTIRRVPGVRQVAAAWLAFLNMVQLDGSGLPRLQARQAEDPLAQGSFTGLCVGPVRATGMAAGFHHSAWSQR